MDFIDLQQISFIDKNILIELVSNGTLKVNRFEGKELVDPSELDNQLPIRQRFGYKKFISLAETPIHISGAADKYSIPQQTISRWVKRGLIAVLGHQGRKTLISEGDIAYFSSLYHELGGSQGKWAFTAEGKIYTKKYNR